jgi:hypothetical protein
VVTLVALVAGVILSAREPRREPGDASDLARAGRWLALVFADLVASVGALFLAVGVFDWIAFAPLVDPARAGDGLGLIPLTQAIVTTTGGVVTFGFGLALVLMSSGALGVRWFTNASERAA